MRLITILIFISSSLFAQKNIDKKLLTDYDKFRETTITHRRFKHADIEPLILKLKNDPQFKVATMGQSIEGRNIYLISIGSGATDVLLWSQMHGDEPTATMALMDLFNFFGQKNNFKKFKQTLKKELTLHFIPMLNPDGAEKYQRRNALGVDLNRDALRLQNPESRILKKVRDSLEAEWGFNLHDQSRYYAAGRNAKTASISFLAPAYNFEKNINKVRGNAMKLIAGMNDVLQKHLPEKIARYNDSFEPRAFGDNITKWGTSTILIESGGLKNDREKQYLRKLHFVALLSAFQSIATRGYEKRKISEYESIPFNRYNAFHDLILRKANIELNEHKFVVDISFRRSEVEYDQNSKFFFQSYITDIGDLSTSYAYEEFDASAYQTEPAKIYPKKLANKSDLRRLDLLKLLSEGYTHFIMQDAPDKKEIPHSPFSFSENQFPNFIDIQQGKNPSLLLLNNGRIEKILANGFLFDLSQQQSEIMMAVNSWLNE
ncbi:MAG: M14 metallopeptidase family protein [Bacteroidota bacterium]